MAGYNGPQAAILLSYASHATTVPRETHLAWPETQDVCSAKVALSPPTSEDEKL
jgi:hypothetical protein